MTIEDHLEHLMETEEFTAAKSASGRKTLARTEMEVTSTAIQGQRTLIALHLS